MDAEPSSNDSTKNELFDLVNGKSEYLNLKYIPKNYRLLITELKKNRYTDNHDGKNTEKLSQFPTCKEKFKKWLEQPEIIREPDSPSISSTNASLNSRDKVSLNSPISPVTGTC